MKRIRILTPKPLVKPEPSKPKASISKADPDFFRKLGSISAKKRSLPPERFSEMAVASHPRKGLHEKH